MYKRFTKQCVSCQIAPLATPPIHFAVTYGCCFGHFDIAATFCR